MPVLNVYLAMFLIFKNDKRNLLSTRAVRALLTTKQGVKSCGGVLKFQPTEKMFASSAWQDKTKE